ncbi:MAG: hypothetical protein K9N07_05655 [Candidatus Cloacimonetes bacterium]|nr:hypothetical protein [Candidatus Cloacimonadota bacterium]
MKKIGFVIFAAAVLFSGCAVMNTSMMETAEISKPGHPKIGVEYGYGLDLTTTLILSDINPETVFNASGLLSLPVYGMKAGIGLTEKMDITGKLWVSIGGVGSKIYLKHKIPNVEGNVAFAVAPGITFVTTESDEETDNIADINSYGLEVPFLATYRIGTAFAVSGMIRYSADFLTVKENDFKETYMLNRLGIVGGLSFDLGPFYLRPELGVEMATPKYGTFGAAPIFAIGAGLDF